MLLAKAWPSSANGSDRAIMLLLGRIKRSHFQCGFEMDAALKNCIATLLYWKVRRRCRANGLIGRLFSEWTKAAEVSQDKSLTGQIVKFAMDWVETACSSGSLIERAALCCVLANFRIVDRTVLDSPNCHLLSGHYLSQAGHFEQARRFLTSGILYYATFQLPDRLWRCEFLS